MLLPFLNISNAQNIDRGPYLQLVTTNSIFIHWRTDSSTDSRVWYGDDPNSLNNIVENSNNTTDHALQITGLNPNTIYYYAVGNSNGELAGGDFDHYFKTSPSTSQNINVWVLGDAGTANEDQRSVRDAYYNYIGNSHIDMMLLLGDNAYSDGDQIEYQESWFENMYEDRLINSVMWSTFGNHDGVSANSQTESGPYYDIFNFPRNGEAGGVSSNTEAYYSFDYGNVHVICLNSHDIDASANSPMMQWLQNDVNANTKEWMIAMLHHPAYRGSVTDIQANALPILEDGGVDLVVYGHYHRYERSFLINGHYGSPGSYDPATMTIDDGDGRINGDGAYNKTIGGPNNGVGAIYLNTGSAGVASSGSSPHPIMTHNAGILGSVNLNFNDLQLDVEFIDENGAIEDYFTIIKQDGPPTVTITNPNDNDFFPTPEEITIIATANDNNGTITFVEFFIDNVSIGSDYSAPYSINWTPSGSGTFEIKAVATDNDDYTDTKTINVDVGDGSTCVKINNGNDDVEEDNSGGMDITSSDLEMIEESTDQIIGLRFTNLNIPQGAAINSAYLQFTCDEASNINPCNLEIYAEDIDDAPVFTGNDNDVSFRTKTNIHANWSPANWNTVGEKGPDQKTVDISSVIQAVVDRPGFNDNSAIVLIIEGTGKRVAESHDGSINDAPELCVEFSAGAPLPIELLSFEAQEIDKKIKLDWVTVSEINNDFFTLERSVDGRIFTEVTRIPGNGTTSDISKYSFIDEEPKNGMNYYRLKQTDFNEEFTYSKIVSAEIKNERDIYVYPSKVEDEITIEKKLNLSESLNIQIHDVNGKTFKEVEFPRNESIQKLSLIELPSGVYFVSVFNDKLVESFKIIKL